MTQNSDLILAHLYSGCHRCKLYESSKHCCIPGKGDTEAKIVLVGEAPGSMGESTGKPFMGRAGKLLDGMLEQIDLRNKVYITNAVKCRPPENRKPKLSEIDSCREYLVCELQIIRPRVIVILGRTAATSLGRNNLRVGEAPYQAGVFGISNVWLIMTWHPAYCLRRGKGAVKDLEKALLFAKDLI